MKRDLIVACALLAPTSATYVWPSKQDQIEDLVFLQSGYIKNGALSDRKSWVRSAFMIVALLT